ncbi:nuclear transport factor 2 family protein [Actinoallomurus soli]|uniref:nuclear transport factor 2 family protein n=1 Tax=Actinoallomurus soli TaxID=2952535 RepID=UPI002093307E|nr:nuclear transport factor 2 family protein [Actinoallomurus soli]MCO5967899.1 nuclear transport factor 2 family protein [Actinoallomurus soli]
MTRADAAASLAEMLDERRHLLRIAEWMFGAVTADQVVHETYRRWYELDDDERASIAVPRAWLTRVAGGICLDLLADCEHGDPAIRWDTVRRAEPHRTPDPIAAWLQRRPRQDRSEEALLARHDQVVRRFAAACDTADTTALEELLAADAMVVSDGGGKVRAAVHPTHGADAVARFITTLLAGRPRTAVTVESVNGRTGLVLHRTGQVVAVAGVSTAGAEVTAVWITLNPDKLRSWRGGPPPSPRA